MLGKLIKKDMTSTFRFFLPLIIGYIAAGSLGKILFEVIFNSRYSTLKGNLFYNTLTLFSVIYFSLFVIYLIACHLMTNVFIVYDFYKTMVGDHAYLTHTLPVKTSTLIWSKTLTAVIWQIIINLVIVMLVFLFCLGHLENIPFREIFQAIFKALDIKMSIYIFCLTAYFIISLFYTPLMFFASIAIGQLWKNHRILGAILTYIAIYGVTQISSTMIMLLTGFRLNLISHFNMNHFFNGYMIVFLFFTLIVTTAYFLITNYILSRKLNLE